MVISPACNELRVNNDMKMHPRLLHFTNEGHSLVIVYLEHGIVFVDPHSIVTTPE